MRYITEITYMYVIIRFSESVNLIFLNLGNSAIDWEKRRYELAKDYSTEFVKLQHKKGITDCGILYPDVVSWSVELADALIKKLKGE